MAKNETAVRTGAAAVMIAVLGGAMYADAVWLQTDGLFQLIILLVAGAAATECCRMAQAAGHRPPIAATVAGTLLVAAAARLAMAESLDTVWQAVWLPAALVAAAIGVAVSVARRIDWRGGGTDLAFGLFTVVYVGVATVWFATAIRHLNAEGIPNGLGWTTAGAKLTVAFILTAKSSDIFAYLGGRTFGRTKMTPRISPKKTWEGLAAGLVGSSAVAVGFYLAPGACLAPVGSVPGAIVFGLVTGGASVLGDLSASLLKRTLAAKDSGQSVPGFGGVLDVIDSFTLAAPVGYLTLRLLSL